MSKADDIQKRTDVFAVETARFCRTIPLSAHTQRIVAQLVAAGTSVGANYRAARRARSHAEFTAKIGIVAEEADEAEYWYRLIVELELGSKATAARLRQEASELMKIFGASAARARSNRAK
ncbi:MAG: four helix bundle protein [Vicinamibacterales bacterium]|nr:four helix bundle protein [Vicinamibacterales bacterium]